MFSFSEKQKPYLSLQPSQKPPPLFLLTLEGPPASDASRSGRSATFDRPAGHRNVKFPGCQGLGFLDNVFLLGKAKTLSFSSTFVESSAPNPNKPYSLIAEFVSLHRSEAKSALLRTLRN
jgi:hypothetical protein